MTEQVFALTDLHLFSKVSLTDIIIEFETGIVSSLYNIKTKKQFCYTET